MPLYEYACEACGHRFEIIQKFSDPPLDVCPKCGGAVRKLQSAPAFQFKGSGWYITDYARKDQSGGTKEAEPGGDSKGAKESSDKSGDKSGEKSADRSGTSDKSSSSATPAPAPTASAPPSKD